MSFHRTLVHLLSKKTSPDPEILIKIASCLLIKDQDSESVDQIILKLLNSASNRDSLIQSQVRILVELIFSLYAGSGWFLLCFAMEPRYPSVSSEAFSTSDSFLWSSLPLFNHLNSIEDSSSSCIVFIRHQELLKITRMDLSLSFSCRGTPSSRRLLRSFQISTITRWSGGLWRVHWSHGQMPWLHTSDHQGRRS